MAVTKYSSEVQQPVRATAILGGYQHTRGAAPLTASRSAPVATDQKVITDLRRALACPLRARYHGLRRSVAGTHGQAK
jgi:hypothetical protein